MQKYLDLKHMEPTYYTPRLTTKLRVVFNASACLPRQTSLNDHLLSGPKLQRYPVTILLNFQLYPFVLTADIKMIYQQILVRDAHCVYQRLIWRFSPQDPFQDYRLKTVTYGISSVPYFAIRVLLKRT